MKNIIYKVLSFGFIISLFSLITIPLVTFAVQVTVPSAPQAGDTLMGASTGNWLATSTLFISPGGYIGIGTTTFPYSVTLDGTNQGNFSSFGAANGNIQTYFDADSIDSFNGITGLSAFGSKTNNPVVIVNNNAPVLGIYDDNTLDTLIDCYPPSGGSECTYTDSLPKDNVFWDFATLMDYGPTTGLNASSNFAKTTTGASYPTYSMVWWDQANGNQSNASSSYAFFVASTTEAANHHSGMTSIALGDIATSTYSSTNGINPQGATIQIVASSTKFQALGVYNGSIGTSTQLFGVYNTGLSSTTNLIISSLSSCSGSNALNTNSSGQITCGATSGSGGVFPFTPTTNFGAATNATGTPIWFQAGLQASSTIQAQVINIDKFSSYNQDNFLFAYGSTTNGVAILGQQAGGQNATTSATLSGTTAFGFKASNALLGGLQNTAIGYEALLNATSSQQDTAIGYLALRQSTTVSNAGSNTAVGYLTLTGNTSGINNVAIGGSALTANTIGNSNTAVGLISLQSNGIGGQNTGVGQGSLSNNTSGSSNTALGYSSMLSNVGGGSNTAVGRESINFSSGSNNTAVGYRAGFGVISNNYSNDVFLGYQSANAVTTGSGNVFAGYQAGGSLTTGSANIVLGQNVDIPVIGNSGQLNIGNVIYGTGLYNNSSTLSATALAGLIGIGTSTPYATLSINSGLSTGDAFVVATSTGGQIMGIDNDGHQFTSGTTTVSSCGTGASINGDDQGGTITTGTAATSCTITFSKAYRNTPYMSGLSDNSATIVASVSTISTTGVTFSLGAGLTGGQIYYSVAYHK